MHTRAELVAGEEAWVICFRLVLSISFHFLYFLGYEGVELVVLY